MILEKTIKGGKLGKQKAVIWLPVFSYWESEMTRHSRRDSRRRTINQKSFVSFFKLKNVVKFSWRKFDGMPTIYVKDLLYTDCCVCV